MGLFETQKEAHNSCPVPTETQMERGRDSPGIAHDPVKLRLIWPVRSSSMYSVQLVLAIW